MNLTPIKRLFLIDVAGAAISAVMLGVILVKFQEYFGIPISTLYFLAFIPILFVLYDIYAFYQDEAQARVLMKGIALLNIMYCILSLGFAFFHSGTLTGLGWIYVIVEVMIILLIARVEWRTATNL